jgi:hypothetical protein
MVNLVLEKRERVTMGGKGRDEIASEIGKIIGHWDGSRCAYHA